MPWKHYNRASRRKACRRLSASLNGLHSSGAGRFCFPQILTAHRSGARVTPLHFCAGVAEQADARDLKSLGLKSPSRFDPGLRHHAIKHLRCSLIYHHPEIASCFASTLPVLGASGTTRDPFPSEFPALSAASFLTPSDKSASQTMA